LAEQSERPQDWSPAGVRRQVEDSLRRLQRDHIDLLQLHNVRIDAVRDDALWDELVQLRTEGKVRALGVALGPAIGWVEEGLESLRSRDIAVLQTVFNLLEQEPGLTFAREPAVQEGRVGMIARVPHASDVLSGKITRDSVFAAGDHRGHRNRDNMLDNFEKAERLAYLWTPETGRTIGQAAVAGILANDAFTTVLPTCVSADEVREYAASSELPLSADEKTELDDLWARNFDHTDRFVMPLKSSV
jgi:aryl-alcohol dehydrogenase-like predicted oxidoreductase